MSHPGNVNVKLANAPTSPYYAILMLLMIVPYTGNCLTCLVFAQVKLQHAVPVQQRYKLQPTMENITHPLLELCHSNKGRLLASASSRTLSKKHHGFQIAQCFNPMVFKPSLSTPI